MICHRATEQIHDNRNEVEAFIPEASLVKTSERWVDAVIENWETQQPISKTGSRIQEIESRFCGRIVYGRIVNFAVCTSDCPLTRSRTRTSIE